MKQNTTVSASERGFPVAKHRSLTLHHPQTLTGRIHHIPGMPHRDAVPLYKNRHAAFVAAAERAENISVHKQMASLLSACTGGRADTICHTHKSWFTYDSDALYYVIPARDHCRKGRTTEPCGDCARIGHEEYQPKTPSGEGRQILITNTWTNPVTKEEEYHGLRDLVERYFALEGPGVPDGLEHGHTMIEGQGPGISNNTLNRWVREVAAAAGIQKDRRRQLLINEIGRDDSDEREREQFVDHGTDADGNPVPDVMAHDLRASFCTQLMRNDVHPQKAISKTGHKDPDSLKPYIYFVRGEISAEEEANWY